MASTNVNISSRLPSGPSYGSPSSCRPCEFPLQQVLVSWKASLPSLLVGDLTFIGVDRETEELIVVRIDWHF